MLIGDTLVTAGTGNVVSLDAVKEHLNVLHDEHNLKIQAYIDDAISTFERITGTYLRSQTREATYSQFPYRDDWLTIPTRPVSAVTWVKYYATSGVQATLADTQNVLTGFQARIKPPLNECWPAYQAARAEPVSVRYVVGYLTPSAIPADVIGCLKLIVGDRYENLGDDTRNKMDMPAAAERIMRLHGFGTPA
jgi:uncharacterized phiE125 gp8 family phage protein